MLTQFFTSILSCIFPLSKQEHIIESLNGICPSHLSTHKITLPHNNTTIPVVALSDYSDKRVSSLIQALKYNHNRESIKMLSALLGDYLLEVVATHGVMHGSTSLAIIPMPLAKARKHARGFNQIEVLLAEVLKRYPDLASLVYTNILIKHTDTQTQTHLSRQERLTNVRGCFACQKNFKKHVILIDDVLTTGATALEASKTLLAGGAQSITVLTLARSL